MMAVLIITLLLTCTSVIDGSFEACITGPTLTDAQRQIIVNTHNVYRRHSGATNMVKLEYNMELEKTAQKAADRCIFGHSPHTDEFRATHLNPSGFIGENIFVTTSPTVDADVPVTTWWSEIADYTFATRACKPGRICGHYTMMMWANSRMVGCAVKKCDSITEWEGRAGLLLFCQYAPGGNIKGKWPFEQGKACTNCLDIYPHCDRGLCSVNPQGPKPTPRPVTVVTGDEICAAREAPDSFMCLQRTYYDDAPPGGDAVCGGIKCSTSRLASYCCNTPSYDGLPCGVGKICKDGRCGNDPTGKTSGLRPGCLYGDMKKFRWDNKEQTCADMIANENYGSHFCGEDQRFKDVCCETCQKYKTNDPGCPYGNHPSCSTQPKMIQCLKENYQCCDKSAIPGGCP